MPHHLGDLAQVQCISMFSPPQMTPPQQAKWQTGGFIHSKSRASAFVQTHLNPGHSNKPFPHQNTRDLSTQNRTACSCSPIWYRKCNVQSRAKCTYLTLNRRMCMCSSSHKNTCHFPPHILSDRHTHTHSSQISHQIMKEYWPRQSYAPHYRTVLSDMNTIASPIQPFLHGQTHMPGAQPNSLHTGF